MAENLKYTFSITSPFLVAKCVGSLEGAYTEIPAADADAVEIPGAPTFVEYKEMMFVMDGAFDLITNGALIVTLSAGDLAPPQRYRTPIQIVAKTPGASYICLTPQDGTSWNRQSGFVAAGGSIDIVTPETPEGYVYIFKGQIGENLGGSLIPVTTGTVTLNATLDTYFLHVWRTPS